MPDQSALDAIGHLSASAEGNLDESNQQRYRLPVRLPARLLDEKGWLFVVARSVSAEPNDQRGSELAVSLIQQTFYRDRAPVTRQSLLNAFEQANTIIFKKTGVLFNDLSSSVVCAVVRGAELHVAHVGDCRAYLVGPQSLRAITSDHVLVEEAEPNEAPTRLLTRSLGSTPAIEVDLQQYTLRDDERLLLCTPALTHVLSDDELQTIVAQHEPQAAAQQLVDLARERGSSENLSVLCIDTSALQPAPVPAAAAPLVSAPALGSTRSTKMPSLALTGIIGLVILFVVLAARGFLGGASTPSVAASLTTPTPIASATRDERAAAQPTLPPSPSATATLRPTSSPTASPTPTSSATPTSVPSATPTATDTPEPPAEEPPAEEPPPPPPTATRPRPTATRTVAPTPTPPPPPAVQPRYPALKLREPQYNQEVTGNAVTLEFEVVTLLPGDTFEIYFKRTASQSWDSKCLPIVNGKCVLTFDRVQGSGSYDWTAVIVDGTGFVVSRFRDVSRFNWNPLNNEPTPKPGCTPSPSKRC